MERLSDSVFVTYFSGYSAHAVEYEGILYPTVEHAYHCQRYSDAAITNEILTARSPRKAWEISQKYKAQQRADFSDRKAHIMEELNRAKMLQHEDIQRALIESNDMPIIKHIFTGSPADGFWDDGVDGAGRNEMGKIWMRLREELKRGTTAA
jgi:N-glycosidase YbiA